jgi:hypothetical protein
LILGKVRNLKDKRIQKEREHIQADYELESRQQSPVTQKYQKKYTMKQWRRFSPAMQQILSNRYDVVLVDHETRNEKIRRNARKITLKNFDKGMKKFDTAQKQFWSEWDEGFTKQLGGSVNPNKAFFGSKKSRVRVF